MIPSFEIIIPARFSSERLPGKPLRDICGKTLIHRVYECALESSADSITVATDSVEVLQVARKFGAKACLTRNSHLSGTDRLTEAVEIMGLADDRIIINLQGDEPRVPGALIDQVAECLTSSPEAVMATACYPIESPEDYENRNIVKVVRDRDGFALYFSRAPRPWRQVIESSESARMWQSIAHRHIGIYAYQVRSLRRFSQQKASPPEEIEKLEQLRVLWNGGRIVVCDAIETPGPGVDTLEELETAKQYFSQDDYL